MNLFQTILNSILPIILISVPKLQPISGLILHAVSTAETIGGAGTIKKDIATLIILDGVAITNKLANRVIIDPNAVPDVSKVIDDVISAINAVQSVSPEPKVRAITIV